jgi:hypothetical protein
MAFFRTSIYRNGKISHWIYVVDLETHSIRTCQISGGDRNKFVCIGLSIEGTFVNALIQHNKGNTNKTLSSLRVATHRDSFNGKNYIINSNEVPDVAFVTTDLSKGFHAYMSTFIDSLFIAIKLSKNPMIYSLPEEFNQMSSFSDDLSMKYSYDEISNSLKIYKTRLW